MTGRELIEMLQHLPASSLDATVVIDRAGVAEEVVYEHGEIIINPDEGDDDDE